jgi:sugar lactone lactonase YvrE
VRKVAPDGAITTFAGIGGFVSSGDGGQATAAGLERPCGLAIDRDGALYIAEGRRIRKVLPSGTITTFAGSGSTLSGGDGGPAVSAGMQPACAPLTFDAAGSLYFGDGSRVRRVTPDGIISRFSGSGAGFIAGYSGDGGLAANATLNSPQGVSSDNVGNLYIGDAGNFRLRKVDAATGIINTVAGSGEGESSGDGGVASNANLGFPFGLAFDQAGNLYVSGNSRIRKIDPSGTISAYAGNGMSGYSGDGGAATQASIHGSRLAADGAGNLYLTDSAAYRVRMVSASGIMWLIAGNGHPQFSGDGGRATLAGIGSLSAAVPDRAGNLYIGDGNSRIRKVTAEGIISTIAGTGQYSSTGDGGAATAATLRTSDDLAFDSAGNLYFADVNAYVIRKITPGGIISTYAGRADDGGFSGDGGQATAAKLSGPSALVIDSLDNLYFTDRQAFKIRKVTPAGLISTVVGNGQPGFSGDGGFATSASFRSADALALDAAGNLYFSDSGNRRIRKVTLAVSQPRTVVEYYNATLRHYFITAELSEQLAVDSGAAGPGWVRTGDTFKVFVAAGAPQGTSRVCRFFGSVTPGPNSHFYTASAAECDMVRQLEVTTPAGQRCVSRQRAGTRLSRLQQSRGADRFESSVHHEAKRNRCPRFAGLDRGRRRHVRRAIVANPARSFFVVRSSCSCFVSSLT